MNKEIGMRLNVYEQRSDCIVAVKIDTKPITNTVLQVYMLAISADSEESEEISEEIKGIEILTLQRDVH